MKFLLPLIALLFIGCTDKYVLIPQKIQYPLFPIEEFVPAGELEIEIYVQDGDVCLTEKDFANLVTFSKENKSEYNLLIQEVQNFNKEIAKINEKQRNKEPIEVDSYIKD